MRFLFSVLVYLLFLFPVVPNVAQAGPVRAFFAENDMDDGQSAGAQTKVDEGDFLASGARVLRDRAYGVQKRQDMDVYIPSGAREAPVIVMVHGGAWRVGDKRGERVVKNKGRHFLENGMIFVSVNYRMLPDADPYVQAKDVALALAYVQANAASWGGDPRRVILMGHSAGAHLVALLAANPRNPDWGGVQPWSGTIVLDSGAMNVPDIMNRDHWAFYDRAFGKDASFWQKTSPLHHIVQGVAPMLIVCSTKRKDEPCKQAAAFAAQAEKFGVKVGQLPQKLSHSDINDKLGLEGDYTKEVDSFIDEVLQDSNR